MPNETPPLQTKKGQLSVVGGVLHVSWLNKNGKKITPLKIADEHLSPELKQRKETSIQQLHGQEVNCQLSQGALHLVSEATCQITPATTTHNNGRRRGQNPQTPREPTRPCVNDGFQPPAHDLNYRFENPYNFVPAPLRVTKGELADAQPIGHHRYHPDHWSGRIQVELTTVTPLLIPDNGTENSGHKTFGIRLDKAGKPYLPPTSIKGMLRSAFEAVTNSRMGVFCGHDKALQYWVWIGYPDRQTYAQSPSSLLNDLLHPATSVDKLSPADRVFGWVRAGKGDGTAAYKGQLRIGPVQCDSPDPVESFQESPVPLAILGAPKPAQSRFYVAKDKSGEPLPDRIDKNKTYATKQGLRGRKVYPHHAEAVKHSESYWRDHGGKIEPVTSDSQLYREWSRPEAKDKKGQCFRTDEQNRSVSAWIKPDSKFTFSIDITNLSDVELGALLWLLNLPEKHHHRLGGGKPLGFGSILLGITSLDLRKGQAIANDYVEFGCSTQAEEIPAIEKLISIYKQACIDSYSYIEETKPAVASSFAMLKGKFPKVGTGDADVVDQKFKDIPFICAFLNAAKGGNRPVHYPRSTISPSPDGKNYEWFVANEKGEKRALPALWNDNRGRGLPVK